MKSILLFKFDLFNLGLDFLILSSVNVILSLVLQLKLSQICLIICFSVFKLNLILLILDDEFRQQNFMLFLSMSNIFSDLRNFSLNVFCLKILILCVLSNPVDLILVIEFFPPKSLRVVHQECLFELRDFSLLDFDCCVSSLDIKLMLSIKMVQIFDFSLKMLFPLNLLLLEKFFILGVLLLIKDSLLLVSFSSHHDLLDGILSLSVHLFILELLVVCDDFGDYLDVWMSQIMETFDVITCLRNALPGFHLLVEALV